VHASSLRNFGQIWFDWGETGDPEGMTIGTSLFLLAVGAILRYAVNDEIQDIDLSVIGLILMIVGAIGLVLGLFLLSRTRRDAVVVDRDVPPRDRY